MENKKILVYSAWLEPEPVLIGMLYADINKGREVYSFEYADSWLSRGDGFISLDPDLYFHGGRQYPSANKKIFGFLSDSIPDRWGRALLQRKENIIARSKARKPEKLTELDFLLGVYDKGRIGALRLKQNEEGEFLSKDEKKQVEDLN